MADLVLGVAKSLVEGTLTKAQAAIKEESKLQQSTQRDLVFIIGEFQMMQSFLSVTTEEQIRNNIVSTWVTQVRDLAYDVEDCIEFVVHLDTKSNWWRRMIPLFMRQELPLDEAVDTIEQLKARVQDVSQRNARYSLICDSGPKPVVEVKKTLAPAGELSVMKQRDSELLTAMLTKKGSSLQVISVWEMGDDVKATTIIRKAYDNPKIWGNFRCRAWVKIEHPINLQMIIRSMLDQFYANFPEAKPEKILDVDTFKTRQAAKTEDNLLQEFMQQVHSQTYLVVLEDVSTLFEWDAIRKYLPDKGNGSYIFVSTPHFETASFCTGLPYYQRFSADHSICVFSKEEGPKNDGGKNKKTNREILWWEQFPLIGREMEIKELPKYLAIARINAWQVMCVWGIAGAGKSSLVRNVYEKVLACDEYQKYGWVDVSRPFNLRTFCQNLLLQFHTHSLQANEAIYCAAAGVQDPIKECHSILKSHRCLVVIDDLQSNEEWDLIQSALLARPSESIIIVITNEASIAIHCADKKELVFNVKCLEARAAIDLFKKKVIMKNQRFAVNVVDRDMEIQTLISMCGGLPKVIDALAEFFAPQTYNWMSCVGSLLKMNFIEILETKPEFACLSGLFSWMHSYLGALPEFLKQHVAYLLIFPGRSSIRRRRLLMRWIAEGYTKDSESSTANENGEEIFSKLIQLSMIQPPPSLTGIEYMRMVSFELSCIFREYMISRPMEDNIATAIEIFALSGTCSATSRRRGRHLVIEENWDRDMIVFENIDFSRLRSLTVFGEWRSFFISESMRVLRVLDLENASGVTDEDLEKLLKVHARLKFLSLRRCSEIRYLPSSVGDLRQLQTLDVRHTSVVTLPESIIRLKKLQYFRSGTIAPREDPSAPRSVSKAFILRRSRQLFGLKPVSGLGKLTALHTLGVINVGAPGGRAILKDMGNLSQLRKLGLSGVSNKNSTELCSAISGHAHLESLSLCINKDGQNYLDSMFSTPPKNLYSLKLYGLVDKLPDISMVRKLVKLDLEITMSTKVDMTVIGGLQELCILRICVRSSDFVELDFRVIKEECEERSYVKVKILEIACCSTTFIRFGSEPMRNLEHLAARCTTTGLVLQFEELMHLSKLRKVQLLGLHNNELKQHLEKQLRIHPNRPAFDLQ